MALSKPTPIFQRQGRSRRPSVEDTVEVRPTSFQRPEKSLYIWNCALKTRSSLHSSPGRSAPFHHGFRSSILNTPRRKWRATRRIQGMGHVLCVVDQKQIIPDDWTSGRACGLCNPGIDCSQVLPDLKFSSRPPHSRAESFEFPNPKRR
jgi:hypothetical protein